MAQLNLKLSQDRLDALRRYANWRRTPISWLIRDYVDYLLAGGEPLVPPPSEAPSSGELAALAERGRAFDWLADEPELYSADDGEPI
jgi:Ribbon-helix-helix protein, copG family